MMRTVPPPPALDTELRATLPDGWGSLELADATFLIGPQPSTPRPRDSVGLLLPAFTLVVGCLAWNLPLASNDSLLPHLLGGWFALCGLAIAHPVIRPWVRADEWLVAHGRIEYRQGWHFSARRTPRPFRRGSLEFRSHNRSFAELWIRSADGHALIHRAYRAPDVERLDALAHQLRSITGWHLKRSVVRR